MPKRLSVRTLIIPVVSAVAAIALVILALMPEPPPPPPASPSVSGAPGTQAPAVDHAPGRPPSKAKVPAEATGENRSGAGINAAIDGVLENSRPPSAAAKEFKTALVGYYGDGNGAVLWDRPSAMSALVDRLARAEEDGLDPGNYPIADLKARQASAATDAITARAETEVAFSAAFLAYASDLKVGRLKPRKIDPELFAQTKAIDGAEALSELANRGDVEGFFRFWEPRNPEYRALRILLSRYRRIAADGGWPQVPGGETLKPDMRDPRVAAVRARLKISGDITVDSAEPELFDPGLVMAVKRFQARHGLEADGAVGNNTLAALNVPADERVRQIVLNMERWRWLPEDLGDRYILVNIAGFTLTLVEAGSVKERMRVIVGKPYRSSPVFSGAITYLEINPYWTVPYKLAVEDELPQIKKDPTFIDRLGFEVFHKGKPVDPGSVHWASLSKGDFPYTLRQKPGPRNALGRIKFMFPNEFSVYLHDTPSRGLFSRASRAFSSGCIRVQRPIDLAVTVLRGTKGWDRKRIDDVLDSENNTRVDLAQPMPVHLTYSTAWSGEGGTINFRPDIYGRDDSLHKALFGN